MNKARLLYLGALVAAFAIAIYKAGFISTMSLYLLVFLAAVDFALLIFSRFRLKVNHAIDKSWVNKGETIQYDIAIANPTALTLSPLKLDYQGSHILFKDNQLDTDTWVVYPHASIDLPQQLHCHYRGTYNVGLKSVNFTSFFKLFSTTSNKVETHTITVYPKIHNFERIKHNKPVDQTIEALLCLDKKDKSNFKDIRNYQMGDPLNRIHWKLSAKRDQWITKQYEGNQNQKVKVFINNQINQLDYEQRIVLEDHLIESAVALIKHYVDSAIETHMFWYDQSIQHIEGDKASAFGSFFSALTNMQFDESSAAIARAILEQTNNGKDQHFIVLFSATLDRALVDALLTCARNQFPVFVMLDQVPDRLLAEYQTPFDVRLLYTIMDHHIAVLVPHLEDDQCRLEVLS